MTVATEEIVMSYVEVDAFLAVAAEGSTRFDAYKVMSQ
jgi:hypothetical protein